jgi:coenzyme F420-reducing hydrogenase beta subunit
VPDSIENPKAASLLGPYRSLWEAQSTDPALRARNSGGVVTTILAFLLERGRIEKGLVVGSSCVPPWAEAKFVSSPQEAYAAAGSKYQRIAYGALTKQIDDRTAVVGLPCQIRSLNDRPTALRLGLFCGINLSWRGIRYFLRQNRVDIDEVQQVDYRAPGGGMRVTLRDGSFRKLPPYAWLAYYFSTEACLRCADHTNHGADLSVGDRRPQWSTVVVRTAVGQQVLSDAIAAGRIAGNQISLDEYLAKATSPLLQKELCGGYIRDPWIRVRGRWIEWVPLRVLGFLSRRIIKRHRRLIQRYRTNGGSPREGGAMSRRAAEPAPIRAPLPDGSLRTGIDMPDRKTILILSYTVLSRDPRIRRQISFLKDRYRVITVACGPSGDPDVEHVSITPLLRRNRGWMSRGIHALGRITGWYGWTHARDGRLTAELRKLARRPIDLVIANDVETMKIAVEFSKTCQAPVLLDAHEMEPWHRHAASAWGRTKSPGTLWFCKTYIPQAARMMTVSASIAEHYAREYGLPCEVITNAPFHVVQEPSPVAADAIRMVHHGGTNATRNLDVMFRLMDELDERFSLDLVLVPNDPAAYERLREKASAHPRVRLLPPVPVEEIPHFLNAYDLGIYMLNPDVPNQKLALPNKLFEFVQARLGVAIWPSPEMAALVNQHGLGVVAEDFSIETMARALNSLRAEDVVRFKQASHAAASVLCAERNRAHMLQIVDGLVGLAARGGGRP